MPTISQAVVLIKFDSGFKKWIRVSRRKSESLEKYCHSLTGFYYAKIFEIPNYKKHREQKTGAKHQIGKQIGYITKNGSKWGL
jgi:hypothetical protein